MLMLLLAFFTMSVSAETYPEVEEVQNTKREEGYRTTSVGSEH